MEDSEQITINDIQFIKPQTSPTTGGPLSTSRLLSPYSYIKQYNKIAEQTKQYGNTATNPSQKIHQLNKVIIPPYLEKEHAQQEQRKKQQEKDEELLTLNSYTEEAKLAKRTQDLLATIAENNLKEQEAGIVFRSHQTSILPKRIVKNIESIDFIDNEQKKYFSVTQQYMQEINKHKANTPRNSTSGYRNQRNSQDERTFIAKTAFSEHYQPQVDESRDFAVYQDKTQKSITTAYGRLESRTNSIQKNDQNDCVVDNDYHFQVLSRKQSTLSSGQNTPLLQPQSHHSPSSSLQFDYQLQYIPSSPFPQKGNSFSQSKSQFFSTFSQTPQQTSPFPSNRLASSSPSNSLNNPFYSMIPDSLSQQNRYSLQTSQPLPQNSRDNIKERYQKKMDHIQRNKKPQFYMSKTILNRRNLSLRKILASIPEKKLKQIYDEKKRYFEKLIQNNNKGNNSLDATKITLSQMIKPKIKQHEMEILNRQRKYSEKEKRQVILQDKKSESYDRIIENFKEKQQQRNQKTRKDSFQLNTDNGNKTNSIFIEQMTLLSQNSAKIQNLTKSSATMQAKRKTMITTPIRNSFIQRDNLNNGSLNKQAVVQSKEENKHLFLQKSSTPSSMKLQPQAQSSHNHAKSFDFAQLVLTKRISAIASTQLSKRPNEITNKNNENVLVFNEQLNANTMVLPSYINNSETQIDMKNNEGSPSADETKFNKPKVPDLRLKDSKEVQKATQERNNLSQRKKWNSSSNHLGSSISITDSQYFENISSAREKLDKDHYQLFSEEKRNGLFRVRERLEIAFQNKLLPEFQQQGSQLKQYNEILPLAPCLSVRKHTLTESSSSSQQQQYPRIEISQFPATTFENNKRFSTIQSQYHNPVESEPSIFDFNRYFNYKFTRKAGFSMALPRQLQEQNILFHEEMQKLIDEISLQNNVEKQIGLEKQKQKQHA